MTNTGRKYITYDMGADLFVVQVDSKYYTKTFPYLDSAVRARDFILKRWGMEIPD